MRYEITGVLCSNGYDGASLYPVGQKRGEYIPLVSIHPHGNFSCDRPDEACTIIVLTGSDRTVVEDKNPQRPPTMVPQNVHHFTLWLRVFTAALQGGQGELTADALAVRAVERAIERGYL